MFRHMLVALKGNFGVQARSKVRDALSVQVVFKLPGRDDNLASPRFAQRTHVMTKYKLNPNNGS